VTSTPGSGAPARSSNAAHVAGLSFRNRVILAAGTAGYGEEVDDVIDLARLGGIATKAVSVEPRHGAKPLRVSEFAGGMINAIGLANPGLSHVRSVSLPWLAQRHPGLRVLVNVVGNSIDDFRTVVTGLDAERGVDAFELNVSCPNVHAGGLEFGADASSLDALVRAVRAVTARPLFVKLSPTLGAGIVTAAQVAVDAGADGLTLVNTMPGLVVDTERRAPRIGFGTGGVSGPALLPLGVLATWRTSRALPRTPIIGLGGVSTGKDAVQYLMAGASLVGVGTASMRDPRAPERIANELASWARKHGVRDLSEIIGTLEWPS
jgi:dihydroorotate dehydrogenase (NAD+) catalytic subunit